MRQRDYYFDNAKILLIFLVVFGHFLQSYIETSTFISFLYKFIYTFHMPAFILISGFFAKGIYEKGYIGKITKKLILPYILFQIAYAVFYYFLHSKDTFKLEFFEPHWSLWFLISLFCWNIMLLAFSHMKPKIALVIVLFAGLVAGYFDWISTYFSLSRTIVLFPFFLAGYFLSKKDFRALVQPKAKLAALLVMLIIAIGILSFPDLNEKWFFGSKAYSEFKSEEVLGMFQRAGIYMVQFVMTACFFAFVPRRQFFFTSWGRNTLYVYLLHGFIVRTFRGSDLEDYVDQVQAIPLLLVISLILTALLSSKFITSLTQPIIELKWSKLKQAAHRLRNEYSSPG
ncbi:acyltransferase [Siminovitchia terrae]|uniref:Acyltransferase n=1 Tax=Siminovitchia terrae TaxID=1914933 RepID=A0A429X5U5_SIMTE|nr:acyltransferase family protein [Siminovitchia terrae]RST58742.1 acyltransferase family protein [Siminovitchia terrae]GIN89976.1 acyltransferase [Siminovitchia terrae]GIN94503.1 acyltransferase [Siminovitchia terrae]